MKVLSPNIELQLIGTKPMELFYDSKLESPGQRVNILGFGNDKSGNVEWTDPGMRVHGPTYITFPEKYPLKNKNHEDGRSGQSYQSFPMGTICTAVPGGDYEFTITGRSESGYGRINLNVSCCDWNTRSQYSVLEDSEYQVISEIIGSDYQTIHGLYTVPDNENAWFLQGILEFPDSTDYEISYFSVKRHSFSNKTKDFHVKISDNWYNSSGIIDAYDIINFSINPSHLCDLEGIIRFYADIDGNRYGMVNLVYHEPILLCRNGRFYINSYDNYFFNINITETISRCSKTYKIIPFSNDYIYKFLNIHSEENSGIRHISKNDNVWLTCNCPDKDDINVIVSLKGGIIDKPKKSYLYINDNQIFRTSFKNSIIFGNINIETKVFDINNVSKVEFFIDDIKEFEDDEFPFEWLWNKNTFSKHCLRVKTYYKEDFISEDIIYLWKFF
jgi:hypothetical protein